MKSLISCLFLGSCTFLFSPSVATPIPEKTPQLTQFSSSTTPQEDLLEIVATMERNWESQYRNHLNQEFSTSTVTPQKVEQSLKEAQAVTGSRAAFIWINSYPDYLRITISTAQNTENYELPVTRKELRQQVKQFIQAIQTPYLTPKSGYLPSAQQLYQWLIQPIRPSLKLGNIDSLIFCLGKGLRVLPLAALHDGERFLIEDYAVSRLPAFSLTDMEANPLANSDVLAMGASEFKDLIALPAVPIELNTVSEQIGRGKTFLNQDFTLNTLEKQMRAQPYPIVHFATHAKIEAGELSRSYIQLWNEQISLDEFPNLTEQPWWSNVQLLVLSACETAVINPENETLDEGVEMSFAGLALQAGVKAAIASSWDISDHGTLGLMAQFYQELQTAPTKTIALQRAQLTLLNQRVRIEGNTLSNLRTNEPLPESLALNAQQNFSHPYYWATFTVIGNPW